MSLQSISAGLFSSKGSPIAPARHSLTAGARADKLVSRADPDGRLVLETDPQPDSRVEEFSAAKEYAPLLPRSAGLGGTILAAKVSRYLSKSGLII